jgi:UDPglucose 6-dehydrogenase
MSFKIGVVGTGYVGLVSGTSFAAAGNDVLCIDIDEKKVEMMRSGKSPIYEPGLDHLLARNIKEGRLKFSTNLEEAVKSSQIIFLCLPTPPGEGGEADLQYVLKVANDIADIINDNNLEDEKIVVNKSTVPVGTAASVTKIFESKLNNNTVSVVSNPEFLREGFAVEDAMKPERVVIGTSSEEAGEIMNDLYQPFVRSGNPIFIMDEKSAEVTKYAANSFLATKISFMNDLSAYCEKVGADIEQIRYGIGSDSRIGKRFLFAGVGYGGSCFPKDVQALEYSADKVGSPLEIVKATRRINKAQIMRFVDKIKSRFDDLSTVKLAMWGLAFKPNTDDVREAPAFVIIEELLKEGAQITAYDQEAMDNTKAEFGDKINYADDMYAAADGNDALVIVTEWNSFRNPDFDKLKGLLNKNIIFDGRNLFQPGDMDELGYEYYPVGRGFQKKYV